MTTIRDVAKRAGVSPITASRALRGSGYVSAETRSRVELAAAELRYVPNMLANSLRSNRTQTLALVLSDITNPFWTTVARGVEDEASTHGYNVIFCNTDEDAAKQARYLALLLRRRVDGVLLVPTDGAPAAVHELQAHRVEVVLLDRHIPGCAVDTVRGDSLHAACQLVEHLLALGHRRIAILTGPRDISTAQERVQGYCAALAAAGIAVDPPLIFFGAYSVDSGQAMARLALARRPRPTALFAANNFIAVGALRALNECGLHVPDDVSLVSFDDLPFSYTREPFLTVAAQPAYALGQTAARLLLERLAAPTAGNGPIAGNGPAPRHIVLPTEIIVRASTAPPPVT